MMTEQEYVRRVEDLVEYATSGPGEARLSAQGREFVRSQWDGEASPPPHDLANEIMSDPFSPYMEPEWESW